MHGANLLDASPQAVFAELFLKAEQIMHTAIPVVIAELIAAGIIVIGAFYILSPQRTM